MKHLLYLLTAGACLLAGPQQSAAQLIVVSSFNPVNAGDLCGLGFDVVTESVWVYGCAASDLQSYSATGSTRAAVARPGESANDVDVEVAPEALTLGSTALPAGTLLFINGETGPAEIYAVDKVTGTVIDTLATRFGISHVVGGAYHPGRNTFFLVQDNVPGAAEENVIAEIDPTTGDTLHTFQITSTFDVSFGDLEVAETTGHLFVVSSVEGRIAEYEPDGTFVSYHPLPGGVSGLSGIAIDCSQRRAWVGGTGGMAWLLGNFPCGNAAGLDDRATPPCRLTAVYPNPTRATATVVLAAGRSQEVRVAVYDPLGREVSRLFEGRVAPGETPFTLDGTGLTHGLYLVKVTGEGVSLSQRIRVGQ